MRRTEQEQVVGLQSLASLPVLGDGPPSGRRRRTTRFVSSACCSSLSAATRETALSCFNKSLDRFALEKGGESYVPGIVWFLVRQEYGV